MPPKPVCPCCGFKKWRKQAGTGTLGCATCGHILQDYRNEVSDVAVFGQHTMCKRTLKSTRATKEGSNRANPILYHGDRARYLYFECLQLLLRMQVTKLTKLWNLPTEFEVICRDTWALNLSLLSPPPSPEPYFHTQEQDEAPTPDSTEKDKASEGKGTKGDRNNTGAGNVSESSSDTDSSSSSTPDDESEDAESPGMDELLREASEGGVSDSEEEEPVHQPPQTRGFSRKKRTRWHGNDDCPAATICVLVHSCWLMRIPVVYRDFISLIGTYSLPYLDPVRLFPHSLTRHLTKHTKQALSPHRAPTPILLHTITSRLSRRCFERYGIFTPELSVAPILWRTVRHMCGTPNLYALSKSLSRYLELPLMLNAVMARPPFRQTEKNPTSHKNDNVPPELALVATVVIALKLIYGFDEKEIAPKEDWDPARTMPALEIYMDHLRALDASDLENSRTSSYTPSSMTDVQYEDERALDAYFDFCERALLFRIRNDIKAGGNDLVASNFPVGRSMEVDDERIGSDEHDSLGIDGNRSSGIRPVVAAGQVMGDGSKTSGTMVRAGESYTIYNGRDVFGGVPDNYRIAVVRAAQIVGVSEDDLMGVMERFERRLVRRWKEEERKGRRR